MATPIFKITPTVQQYDWGKLGLSSKVAQFATAAGLADFVVDDSSPYAELWMGTHPKSPSVVPSIGKPLSQCLNKNPTLIGEAVIKKFSSEDGNLPFLFKVLAIEKALSIQSHPDLETAKVLHTQQPDIYKDPNHKPEMALALTPFTALCGFLPLPQIAAYLSVTPEFAALVTPSIAKRFNLAAASADLDAEAKQALKDVFSAVMTAEETEFKAQLKALVARYQAGNERDEERDVKDLVLKLDEQFPGDIGIFCVYLLNYVKLQPGEAIFLGAGEPHAYVSGDIMECMANSDNVIRAGLTPKLRDIPNLVSTLTYTAAPATKHRVQPSPFPGASTYSTLYDPPIPEFSVVQVVVPAEHHESHPALEGPSIAIVTEGNGSVSWGGKSDSLELSKGEVFFVSADLAATFTAVGEGLVVYRAFVEA
ncbi:mannose-6-phosphate isomerase [Auriscalpium vulgare]|uniref:Mannose-6-phosphate isomerase n=1 Tax=Auriscalpium vulgare TaxID=40419 RepID=A0ACB8S8L4_9AGAM|nr:mannose-6-phosphate isomerase [Auriscalpium vulgare]